VASMMLRNIEATNTALTTSFGEGSILTTYYKITPAYDVPCQPADATRPFGMRIFLLFTYGGPG
jgi:hypothetical protein